MMILWMCAAAFAGTPLAYDQALGQALELNPQLRVSEAAMRQAEGALLAAQGVFDPNFNGSLNYTTDVSQNSFFTGLDQNFKLAQASVGVSSFLPTGTTVGLTWENRRQNTSYEGDAARLDALRQQEILNEEFQYRSMLSASLSQSVLQGFRMSYNLSAVRRAQRAQTRADAELVRQRNEILAATATAYWDLWYQRRRMEIAEKSLEVAKEESRIVGAKVTQGLLAPVEGVRVAATVVQAESLLIDARSMAEGANDLLATYLGEPPGLAYDLTTEPAPVSQAGIEMDRVVAAVLENNPELQKLALDVTDAQFDARDAKHQLLPDLNVNGSYGLTGLETRDRNDPAGFGSVPAAASIFDGQARTWSLGIAADVPLGNRVDRGVHDQRMAAVTMQERTMEAKRLQLTQQARLAVGAVERAQAQVVLQQANLELAEETLAAERSLSEAGRTVQKDVLEAIKNADDARVNLEKARADYLLAIVELERLKGTL